MLVKKCCVLCELLRILPTKKCLEIMDCCRLCEADASEFTSIFSERHENSVAEMVWLVSAIEINEMDALSKLVCADCVELTVDAFQFVRRVREVDERLRRTLMAPEANKTDACSEEKIEIPEDSKFSISYVLTAGENEVVMQEDATENELPLDGDALSIEYLEEEPDNASKKLISLLIESVKDSGSEKWFRITKDPAYTEVSDDQSLHQEGDENSSSDQDFTGPEENRNVSDKNQAVRCCSQKCRLAFSTRDELVEHGSIAHSADRSNQDPKHSFECVICFQRFDSQRNLLNHLRRLIRDYRCHFCNIYLETTQERMLHMEKNHHSMSRRNYRLEDQPIKICCGCEAQFDTLEELFQHGVDQHLNQPKFPQVDYGNQCNICYKFFKTKLSLRNHQVLVYKPKLYPCSTCGKAFECPSKLANHVQIHTTERNFACSICRGTFKTATDLRGHQRIHQEKSLICSVCGAKFHKKSHLRSHLKTHDDNAYDFSCSLCPKKFKEKSNLKSHLKVHTLEKPYKCEYCPKEFRYATDKKRHEMTHTGNYPHKCSGCGKAFARGNFLQAHIRICEKKHEK